MLQQIILWLALISVKMVVALSLSVYGSNHVDKFERNKVSPSSSSHELKRQPFPKGKADHSNYELSQDLDQSSVHEYEYGYGYKYASNYDDYSTYLSHVHTDLDFHDVDLPYDVDFDLDLDEIDLDLDLLKLKYGLYGLNHYSLHNPHFNDYKFRKRYRLRRRPYFRAHHRYFPQYWKHDLDFWGLDNYGLGYSYNKYLYTSSLLSPSSYVHISSY